ncbi:unnamed protein product [Cercospora beticola]|nr:unnamed protein product [Cercospora beticola]
MALSSMSFLVAALLVALVGSTTTITTSSAPAPFSTSSSLITISMMGSTITTTTRSAPAPFSTSSSLTTISMVATFTSGSNSYNAPDSSATPESSFSSVLQASSTPNTLGPSANPSSTPDALNGTGQGCGYTSPSIGASAETLQSAAIDFCRKNFPDDHDYAFKAHRDGGHDVRVLLTDGTTRSAMFRMRLFWEHVTSVNWISLNQAGCYGFFMAVIKPCPDETGSLVFYGHLNTTIDEVPALFTVTVEPYDFDLRSTN